MAQVCSHLALLVQAHTHTCACTHTHARACAGGGPYSLSHFIPWWMRPYSRDPQWSQKVGLPYVWILNLCLLLGSWEGWQKTKKVCLSADRYRDQNHDVSDCSVWFLPPPEPKNMLVPNWGETLTRGVTIQLQAGGGA